MPTPEPVNTRRLGKPLLVGTAGAIVLVVLATVGWRANALNIRGETAWSIGAAFDDPAGGPGYQWKKDGRVVPVNELVAFGGPDHCGWQSATFVHIGWPPGTFAETAASARQYVRDPKGAIHHDLSLRDRFARGVAPPPDARPTGYKLGAIELYLSPAEQDRWIYLVSPVDIERWPRSVPMTTCV